MPRWVASFAAFRDLGMDAICYTGQVKRTARLVTLEHCHLLVQPLNSLLMHGVAAAWRYRLPWADLQPGAAVGSMPSVFEFSAEEQIQVIVVKFDHRRSFVSLLPTM